MKRYTRLGLAGLLTTIALLAASCGGAGNMGEGRTKKEGEPAKESMKGMNHSKGDHGTGEMASQMLREGGKYSDRRFIDAMVPHHEGAVEMAEVAMKNAEHTQIKRLAENIVSTQEAEIKALKSIKEEAFGTSRVPMDMGMKEMEAMGMTTDPRALAKHDPFDKAFIDSMIPHHQSAIEMAEVAARETANAEIRDLATSIVEAQKREISQMEHWRNQWYPQA